MHLIAPAAPAESAVADLLHEAFHSGGRALVGTKAWNGLMQRLAGLYRHSAASRGKARVFFDAARERVAHAEAAGGPLPEAIAIEEFGAYAVSEYEAAPKTIRDWVDDFLGHVKAWLLRRFGRQVGRVTPAELSALAAAALRAMAGAPLPGAIGGVPETAASRHSIRLPKSREELVEAAKGMTREEQEKPGDDRLRERFNERRALILSTASGPQNLGRVDRAKGPGPVEGGSTPALMLRRSIGGREA